MRVRGRAALAVPAACVALLAAGHATPSPGPHVSAKPAHAATAASPAAGTDAGFSANIGVWTLHTASMDSNFKTGDFTAPGKIVMTREGGDVTADRASGNWNAQQASLFGHVVMHDSEGNFAALRGGAHRQGGGPSTLTADQVHLDGRAKVYTASGNVHYEQTNTNVTSDKAVLNDDTSDLFLEGSVHIAQGARNLRADKVHYNTDSGDSHAEGDVVLQFPSTYNPTIATPRPINIRNPLSKQTAQPSPAVTQTP